jgi:hypothetical protein
VNLLAVRRTPAEGRHADVEIDERVAAHVEALETRSVLPELRMSAQPGECLLSRTGDPPAEVHRAPIPLDRA